MARGRWQITPEALSKEAYVVLIGGKKPTRAYPKSMLEQLLESPEVYLDFLKLCLEHEKTENLVSFRRGLLLTVRAIGPSKVARETGISRVTLHRMLQKGGNPRLTSLMVLFRFLGLQMWVVDRAFIVRKRKLTRPKDQKVVEILARGDGF